MKYIVQYVIINDPIYISMWNLTTKSISNSACGSTQYHITILQYYSIAILQCCKI